MEERPKSFEEIRQETEDAQRSILWPDYLRANRATFAFLWHGDQKANLVQRAGLIIFGLFWLSMACVAFDSFLHSEDRNPFPLIPGITLALLALRILRNAFLRAPGQTPPDDQQT
jgi:hypothetical protein